MLYDHGIQNELESSKNDDRIEYFQIVRLQAKTQRLKDSVLYEL